MEKIHENMNVCVLSFKFKHLSTKTCTLLRISSIQCLLLPPSHHNGNWVYNHCMATASVLLSVACLSRQVFDVTRKVTYKNLSHWYQEMRGHRPDIPCILVANKIDGEAEGGVAWVHLI